MTITATAAGFGAGVSSSIGRALGAGDLPYARSLTGTSIALALVGSQCKTGGGFTSLRPSASVAEMVVRTIVRSRS